jgi:two-component system chemotaxis response regulator CheB
MGAAPDFAVREKASLAAAGPVRVLIVDDSPTVRAVLTRLVEGEPDLCLAAAAGNAEEALAVLVQSAPDVILLDLDMPGMGGLDAIPRILELSEPARVLVVSSLTVRGAEQTLTALSLGAADTMAKPQPGKFDQDYRATLLRKIRLLGRVARRARGKVQAPAQPALRSPGKDQPQVLAIGASTGGIHALAQMLGSLSRRVTIPILVTQHLPASFIDAFARQLRTASGRGAEVAAEGMPLAPGGILIAPGNAHMTVAARASGRPAIKLQEGPVASGCCPSVDPMFASCAATFGSHAMGVVLSGMGRDGADGASRIVSAGGSVLAQDAASSAVWGMPGAVATAGLASAILPPDQLADRVAAAMGLS